jgi:hypothetical protein
MAWEADAAPSVRRGGGVGAGVVVALTPQPARSHHSRGRIQMPENETIERARRDRREGKSPSTQAGEFVREEIHHVREGKHGARSTKQAIAIGLSKARRAGVKLPPQKGASTSGSKRRSTRSGGQKRARPSTRRSAAVRSALRREGRSAASPRALARHARTAARRRSAAQRSASAKKAVRTKGPAVRKAAARKAARTRARRRKR